MSSAEQSPFGKIREINELRNIVRGDIIRRHAVWRKKGMKNREILEGTLAAVLNGMYVHDEDPWEWLSVLDHIEEQVHCHRARINNALTGIPSKKD